ncbi:hypothetical protein SLEP1_g58630 [Rubroshorea leprosula]|uniref:Uncharacterized protein n=1 Tax=Rubroshorea leprosula TaxID=152421 RepID=A0AAV5MR44_9ROSI|nr:hypothetical protein SLEP1_g58630 [Rubroshorea leprosula]
MAEVGKEKRTGAHEAAGNRQRLPGPPLSEEEEKIKMEEQNRKDRKYRAKMTGNNNSKNQLSENSTAVDYKRKSSVSPTGRAEDILPILKKLESREFDYLPTNEEVILTDLIDFLIVTTEPPVKMVKKNMSTPVKDEWEWEDIIAEEYNVDVMLASF